MKITAETLNIRLSRLQRLIAESTIPEDAPLDKQWILQKAPQMLHNLECTFLVNDNRSFGQLLETMEEMESMIKWAVGTDKGEAIVWVPISSLFRQQEINRL